MSEVLILEFADGTAEQYNAVNKILGIDSETGAGDWPAPLESHTGAIGPNGLVVFEVWESRELQARFMERLGPALGQAGVSPPTRQEWLTLLGQHQR